MNNNPLMNYARVSVISVKLPSKGIFNPDITFDLSQEIKIYPMTIKDEININQPDILLSGQAIIDLIKSCAPNIHDPGNLPHFDINFLNQVIKKISKTTNEPDFIYTCSKCSKEYRINVNIEDILDSVKYVTNNECTLDSGLKVFIRPSTFNEITEYASFTFPKLKELKGLEADTNYTEDEKEQIVLDIHKKFEYMVVDKITSLIIKIELPDGTIITDTNFIKEFIDNCNKKDYNIISELAKDIDESGITKNVEIDCECGNSKALPLYTKDMSAFFG